jgi:hypothetical protein
VVKSKIFPDLEIKVTHVGNQDIISHDELTRIYNEHQKRFLIEKEVIEFSMSPLEIFVLCKITDNELHVAYEEYGEANRENLGNTISKQYPGIMAFKRAFDRALIQALQLNGDKIYSDNEIEIILPAPTKATAPAPDKADNVPEIKIEVTPKVTPVVETKLADTPVITITTPTTSEPKSDVEVTSVKVTEPDNTINIVEEDELPFAEEVQMTTLTEKDYGTDKWPLADNEAIIVGPCASQTKKYSYKKVRTSNTWKQFVKDMPKLENLSAEAEDQYDRIKILSEFNLY